IRFTGRRARRHAVRPARAGAIQRGRSRDAERGGPETAGSAAAEPAARLRRSGAALYAARGRPRLGRHTALERGPVRLVIISGLSGSGKSVALHLLEDLGYYCIDNIPVRLLRSFVDDILLANDSGYGDVAVGLDARSRPTDIEQLPALVKKLRADGMACEIIFLQAADDVLLTRFSETRRKHPLTSGTVSLREAIAMERDLLGPIIDSADLIVDTTGTTAYALRELIHDRVGRKEKHSLS